MAKDLFSAQAAAYAKYRPSYPADLIEYIMGFVTDKNTAWDCATGNGQVAALLSPHFKKVLATDISHQQLLHAMPKDNIIYQQGDATQTGFADNSINLVTVAQAYHWLNHQLFEKEVKRIAARGAIIAVWGYALPVAASNAIDELIRHFYTAVVGPYWDAERKFVDNAYQTLPFNFEPLPVAPFSMQQHWTLDDCCGYLSSWSSVQHFIKDRGYNPVDEMRTALGSQWPVNSPSLLFRFPIFLRLGRISK
ncbi:MAG TPA: class I SAM-dependent methyltransferase [Chitinophagaceae bacterium]|nr:class I SAM-dependent methyltransferase [Chitinophagaceae bacterium]